MSLAPYWITPADLGVYSTTHSFNLDPVVLQYAAAAGNVVAQINGVLPQGLAWSWQGNSVVISGESQDLSTVVHSAVTWRVTDTQSQVADRTYYLTINPVQTAPSWAGQPTNLGYAASGGLSSYTVTAHTTSSLPLRYSIAQFAPPTGISIAATSGVISYAAPVVQADQTTTLVVRATTGLLFADLTVQIQLLTVPHAPAWVTASGLLAVVSEGQFLELTLEAYDSSGSTVSYALVSSAPTWPFVLTATGLIYGTVPTVYATTVYQFTVLATSAGGTAVRTFDIAASPVTVGSLLYWTSSSDLGTHGDGQFVVLPCTATSLRSSPQYGIVGGLLPRGLILDRSNGQIAGFLEYQTRTRSYVFDIAASDTVQTITRQFVITVSRTVPYQFMNLQIPLEGQLKSAYFNYVGATILPQWTVNGSVTPQSQLFPPFVNLITGLNYSVDDPAAALGWGNLNLNTTELSIGAATNVNVSSTSTLFYSDIHDAATGAGPHYAQADDVTFSAAGLVTVARGSVTVTVTSDITNWLISAVPGTSVRLTHSGDPQTWLQGPITAYASGSLTMVIAATMVSGMGTYDSWQLSLAPVYPASLVNIRTDLISGLGWANAGQGQGASLLAKVDPTSTSVIGADIVAAGSGYLSGPQLTVQGTGTGAVIAANLTVVTASILVGGTAWQVGDVVLLSQPAVTAAQLTVDAVDTAGAVKQLTVTQGGQYLSWPAGTTLLTNGRGVPAEVQLSCGIGNTWVSAGGTGYSVGNTVIGTGGSEQLPSWQTVWQPVLTLGTVYSEYGAAVVALQTPAVTSQLWYRRWPLQHLWLELQGVVWTGDTTLDHSQTSFDGGSTYFTEWLEPRDTIFEQNLTRFNQTNTRFDDPYSTWQSVAYYAWGNTRFDREFTIFDLYNTVFDQGSAPTASVTLLQRLIRVETQQISGHNVVA